MIRATRYITFYTLLFLGHSATNGQPAQTTKPPMSEEVFKNVQVLKGIPADEFMSTMGIFSAALGMSCENCHVANDSKWENYAGDNTPTKITARRMVSMMQGINKSFFNGRQVVTCYSCHRGGERPKTTPNLEALNGMMPEEEADDIVTPAPGAPNPEQILDKYIRALGGPQKLAAILSIAGKGNSSGYGPESEKRPYEIYAKVSGQRTTIIHTRSGDNTTTYDGRSAWQAAPLRPIDVMPVTGGELEGAKFEVALAFPAQLKQALGQWRVGRSTTIEGRKVQVVQGTSAGGMLATLYFDDETGLLVRQLRYANSPVGRIPTQVDYADYRDVNGVKMPFRWMLYWLDGKENVELTELQANSNIDAAKFNRPAASKAP